MQAKKTFSIIIVALLLFGVLAIQPTNAQTPPPPDKPDLELLEEYVQSAFPGKGDAPLAPQALYSPILYPYRLEKADPDECFNGVGQPYSGTVSLGCSDSPIYNMDTQPKVNQAYVWGLTKYNEDVWLGTAPNTLCLVYGGFLGQTSSTQTPSYVCEFGNSQYSPPAPPAIGDWRAPDAFVYDLNTATLVNRDVNPANFPSATLQDSLRFTNTLGIRSAGVYTSVISNTVFLAGPALTGGIHMFAYDADTGGFISSTNVISYTNIRKWINVDGYLYTGVRKNDGSGAVLKYVGDPSVPGQIFEFEEVGMPVASSEAAELAFHDGRLFVSTWPVTGKPASLWMSPVIPSGGLTSADKDNWQKVWQINQYDPNMLTAAMTGGGALASFNGYLYWGTMHVPFMAFSAHMQLFPPDPGWDQETYNSYLIASLLGNHRAISIFRGRNFDTMPEVELLYGEQELPAFVNGSWVIVPNNMGGASPLYGGSGFDNFYNNYTWTMDTFKDELYVGTMDWSYLLSDGLYPLSEMLGLPPGVPLPLPDGDHGADLWRFSDEYSAAEAIDTGGVGNYTNYGIRTMLVDGDGFYLGTANPMNLLTDPYDYLPEGGWELIEMRESPPPPDLAISKSDSSSPAPVSPGAVFTYTLEVTNYGFGAATNVTVQDTLPPGVVYNFGNPNCYLSGDVVICNLGDLDAYDGFVYDSVSTEISVTAPVTVQWLVNKASVYCSQYESYYDNNQTHLLTLVDDPTDLEIEKTASHPGVVVSQTLTYTLTITNAGLGDFVSQVPLAIDNPEFIYIPTFGSVYPYPSDMLYLSGLQGKVSKATVTLDGLTHTRTSDLDIMLVSPQGTKVMLMSDAGGGLNFNTDMLLIFDDDAPGYLPQDSGITSGAYRPTDYGGLIIDLFPSPAPIGLVHDSLAAFQGEDANGYWQLYIVDDLLGYDGEISRGWTLELTLTRQVTVVDDLPEDVKLDNIIAAGWSCQQDTFGDVICTIDVLPAGVPSTIDLVTTVLMTPNQFFTNYATVAPDSYDPDYGNNSADVTVISPKIWFPLIIKQ